VKISVKVKAGARLEGVIKVDDSHYIVCVKAPPVEGKANERLIKLLSDYFHVPKGSIHILKGMHAKNKIVEISESRG